MLAGVLALEVTGRPFVRARVPLVVALEPHEAGARLLGLVDDRRRLAIGIDGRRDERTRRPRPRAARVVPMTIRPALAVRTNLQMPGDPIVRAVAPLPVPL